jgi:hypothetical protein
MSDQEQGRPLSTVDLVRAAETRDINPEPETNAAPAAESAPAADNRPMPLLNGDLTEKLRSQWNSVQAGFVDEPRSSVEQADSLVAEVMKQIAETFVDERKRLEDQWSRGDNVSTEDLRLALQRYRSFFNRLLSL